MWSYQIFSSTKMSTNSSKNSLLILLWSAISLLFVITNLKISIKFFGVFIDFNVGSFYSKIKIHHFLCLFLKHRREKIGFFFDIERSFNGLFAIESFDVQDKFLGKIRKLHLKCFTIPQPGISRKLLATFIHQNDSWVYLLISIFAHKKLRIFINFSVPKSITQEIQFVRVTSNSYHYLIIFFSFSFNVYRQEIL